MRLRKIMMISVLAAIAASECGAAEQPQLTNGKLVERSAKTGVQTAIQEIVEADRGSAWIAYSVPAIPGEHHMCCFSSTRITGNHACCGSCRLDGRDHDVSVGNQVAGCKATLASIVFVFIRFESGSIKQVRTFSTDCAIDAAGATVYLLQDVEPGQSVGYLESLLKREGFEGRAESDEILGAIAFHDGMAANTVLERLVQPRQPSSVRSQAAFWIGSTRGAHGLDVLLALIQSDQDQEFLEQAIFAVSQKEEHQRAFDELVRLARQDASAPAQPQHHHEHLSQWSSVCVKAAWQADALRFMRESGSGGRSRSSPVTSDRPLECQNTNTLEELPRLRFRHTLLSDSFWGRSCSERLTDLI